MGGCWEGGKQGSGPVALGTGFKDFMLCLQLNKKQRFKILFILWKFTLADSGQMVAVGTELWWWLGNLRIAVGGWWFLLPRWRGWGKSKFGNCGAGSPIFLFEHLILRSLLDTRVEIAKDFVAAYVHLEFTWIRTFNFLIFLKIV